MFVALFRARYVTFYYDGRVCPCSAVNITATCEIMISIEFVVNLSIIWSEVTLLAVSGLSPSIHCRRQIIYPLQHGKNRQIVRK
jgi:hypothetical protein